MQKKEYDTTEPFNLSNSLKLARDWHEDTTCSRLRTVREPGKAHRYREMARKKMANEKTAK